MSEAEFKQALAYVTHGPKTKLSDAQQLAMYAAFKQATVGPNRDPAPSAFKFVARAKYDAWKKLGALLPCGGRAVVSLLFLFSWFWLKGTCRRRRQWHCM